MAGAPERAAAGPAPRSGRGRRRVRPPGRAGRCRAGARRDDHLPPVDRRRGPASDGRSLPGPPRPVPLRPAAHSPSVRDSDGFERGVGAPCGRPPVHRGRPGRGTPVTWPARWPADHRHRPAGTSGPCGGGVPPCPLLRRGRSPGDRTDGRRSGSARRAGSPGRRGRPACSCSAGVGGDLAAGRRPVRLAGGRPPAVGRARRRRPGAGRPPPAARARPAGIVSAARPGGRSSSGAGPEGICPITEREEGPRKGTFFKKFRRRPTLPGGFPPSTIGAGGLNFRVRNGNGCNSAAIATGNLLSTGDSRELA